MEIIIPDTYTTNAGSDDGFRNQVRLKFIPDTREVQLWITIIHLESGATSARCYPLPLNFRLLHVEELGAFRMEPIASEKWTSK